MKCPNCKHKTKRFIECVIEGTPVGLCKDCYGGVIRSELNRDKVLKNAQTYLHQEGRKDE